LPPTKEQIVQAVSVLQEQFPGFVELGQPILLLGVRDLRRLYRRANLVEWRTNLM
jgi:hypothetical protein